VQARVEGAKAAAAEWSDKKQEMHHHIQQLQDVITHLQHDSEVTIPQPNINVGRKPWGDLLPPRPHVSKEIKIRQFSVSTCTGDSQWKMHSI
jgi:hypothetical protein